MSRIPRIAFVIDDLGHGGAQRQLLLIVRALHSHAAVHVATLSERDEPYGPRLREAGASVTTMPRRGPLDVRRVRNLIADLRRTAPDVVHGVLDASNVYAFIAARRIGLPIVLSLRSDRLHLGGVRGRVLRSLLRSTHVTANSEAGRRFLVEQVGAREDRVVVVPNVVDAPAVTPHPPEPPVIACVGRAVALKRFDAVIDALAIVRRLVPARLVVLGDGPERERLAARAARLGLAGAVTFEGDVPDAATRMGGFSCVVIASTHEGMPNAALEALAAGVPIVAAPVGDLPELIEAAAGGVVARDAGPDGLAAGIVQVLSDPALAERTARTAPGVVRQRHAPDAARRILLDLYRRVQKESGASTSV